MLKPERYKERVRERERKKEKKLQRILEEFKRVRNSSCTQRIFTTSRQLSFHHPPARIFKKPVRNPDANWANSLQKNLGVNLKDLQKNL